MLVSEAYFPMASSPKPGDLVNTPFHKKENICQEDTQKNIAMFICKDAKVEITTTVYFIIVERL